MTRERIDRVLVERGFAPSRARARAMIEAGLVSLEGRTLSKASELVDPHAALVLEPDHPYVSRGGLKLEGALGDLQVDPRDAVVADIGASTGGFTDCILRHGAQRVYALDVGHAQLHPRLAADARVVSLEGVNARHLEASSLPEPVDMVLVDASFISLTKLLPALVRLLKAGGRMLALVKPQFEVGRENLGKRAVVSDDGLRQAALEQVVQCAAELGLVLLGQADSRVLGPEGNREIFVLLCVPDRPRSP
jgi:23S rRNA (cytidine1920-2'-O)/16S rRNA (cytidine1409-2'-O)-methyltransferase